MNFKKVLLCITCLFCIASSPLFAQTPDTGREVMRGEINFTEMANYYLDHPEALTMKELENEDDGEAQPMRLQAMPDPSMIRTLASSPFTPMAPLSPGAFLPISPAPNDTFESTIDNNTTIPPDTHGAVDSNYCMTTINSTVKIQTRAGVTVASMSLNAFFSPLVTGGVYDPRVHYDPTVHRWIFVADYGAEATTSSLLIAISETSNPTGLWYEFKVLADATGVNWLDFPEVGFNGKWITVSGNMFTVTGSSFSAAKIFVFNKSNLVAGISAPYTSFTESSFTMCPTLTYDTAEKSMFLIESWNAGAGYLRLSKITGAVGSETWAAVGFPTTSQSWQYSSNEYTGTGGADFAPQAGTANKVQTNDDRIDQMICINGKLWFAHTIFLPYSTTVNATRSSIQWWETDTTGTPIQVGNIDDATGINFYAFPSLAVNTSNDLLIGFAAFSATTHPSGGYAVRYHTDPVDSVRPLQIFRHGQNTYYKTYGGSDNRWGDYSGAVMDPLNQTDFWTIQEASSTTANTWDTWWAQVVMCNAPVSITGTATVCAGATTTLADATSGGTWSSSATTIATAISTTGVVTGVSAGTAVITYSTGANCFSVSTLTVNALPVAIGGSAPVCAGSTITLTDATTGGTWASGTTTIATIGTGSGIVTGVAAGTSLISYTLTSTGCRTTNTVTVNSLPAAISASAPFCAGTAITLTDGVTGGTWASGATTIATVSGSGVVSGVSGGTATITYALSTGCKASTTVTVNTTPGTISGSAPVCVGATIALTNGTTGGTWASGSTTIATVNSSGVVTGVASGTAVITYALSTGCSVTTIVTVNGLPTVISGSAPVCAGATFTLTDGTTGGTWASGTTSVATISSSGIVTGVLSGTSVITYSLGTGCSVTAIVTVNTTPGTISGSAPVCVGSTITLTNGTTGGTWASGSTTIATVNSSGVVTSVASGTAVITYALSTGCSVTTIVTVNGLPTVISGSAPVCAGATITLTDGTTGGTWASGTTSVATISSSGIVTGVLPGTSVITYSLGTGCSVTAIVTVNTTPGVISGSAPLCVGSTITLTNGTTGGTWASGSTTIATINSSGVVTGAASGTSIITYALPTGCSVTTIVTVNGLPTAISGSTPVCAGATIALTDGTTGGTWASGTTSVATISSSGIVTGVLSGTSVITYSLGTGCSVTAIVTVNTTPGVISGSAPLCVGSTIALSNGTTGGTWASGSTTIATINSSGVVTGVSSGTAVIAYALPTGCSVTAIVTVNGLPTVISGSAPVCAGATITLIDGTTGGTWVSGTTTVATISGSGIVTGVLPGTSVITYSLGTGCSVTAIVTVNTTPGVISGSAPLCVGATITLTNGTTGGTWASGSTTIATVNSSGVVTGVASGTAIMTYALPTGCSVTTIVTVNGLPTAISGSTPVCAGATIALTDGTTGGAWASGTTSVATISSSGIVTGVLPGTSVITYSLGTGCSVTAIVTVNTTPGTILGSAPVCVGSTITLTNGTTGGTWASGSTTIATVNSSGVVTGVASGTAVITYALPTGCSVTTIVTVNGLPTAISGSAPVCAGATIALTDGTTGGTWVSGTTTVATISGSGVVTGVLPGTSVITYSLSTGCSVTTIVTVNTTPGTISGSAPVCVGSTITLTNGTTGGTWASGSTTIATVNSSGVVTGVASGTAVITYALPTGCSVTAIVTVNGLPTAISGSAPVCAGATFTLTDGTTGGTWASGTTSVATISSSGIVTGVLSGTSVITYSLGTGCSVTAIVTVNTTPGVISGSAPLCVGATITLTNGTTGGTWASGSTTIATVNSSGVVTGVASGTAIMTYALLTGCSVTAIVTVNGLPTVISGSAPVCAGATITLTDGTTGGTWASGTTSVATISSSGIVTGVLSGTSVITYSLGTGCSVTAIVTVNTTPGAISGSAPLCVGSTITLTNGTTGGTWASGSTTIATVNSSGVVTGAASGTSIITYALPTGCSVTTIVTVNGLPTAISGSTPVCAGATIALTDGTTGGAWASGTTSVATISSSGIVTGVLPGTSIITYSLGTGCSVTAIVTVNTTPGAISGSAPVCVGSTITLTNGTTGGAWASGSTTIATVNSSGVVTGVASGTATIIYALSTGCSVTTIVTVNGLPTVISGSAPVCAGATVTLTDGTTGGTWASGTTSVATISSSGIVTGMLPGTSVITYSLGSGCTVTTTVTVNATPGTILGSAPVCAGSTIALTDGITGGTWASGSTTIATINTSGTVTGAASGTSIITYALGTGCKTTAIVTVNPLPASIGGSVPVCAGSTINLTDLSTGGTWSAGSTTIATIVSVSGLVTGISSGTSVITYSLGTGCRITGIVTVNPLPAAIGGSIPLCAGSAVTLTDLSTGGTWTSGHTAVATVTPGTGVVTGIAAGTSMITYTISTGCFNTAIITVNALPSLIAGGATVCTGSTRLLTDATTGGTWSSSSTGIATVAATGVVSGVTTGTATITYTAGTGCFVSTPVTVNALPAAITGNAAICIGGTTALADITTGGTWSSLATTIATINATGLVTAVAAGTTTISYTAITGCSAITHITVNPLPAAITGGTTVCAGSTRLLADPTTGGTWSSSATGIATVNTVGSVNGISSGTAIITYTLGTGCNVTASLTVNSLPSAITGGSSVCTGSTRSLSDATTGGTWSSSATGIATVGSTGILNGVATGSATITYTSGSSCSVTSPITVNSLPPAITGSFTVCTGLSANLSDATTGGTWSSSNTSSASVGLASGIVTAGIAPGTATITYTAATGCSASATVTINSIPVAIAGAGSVCIGSTIALSESGTGTWSSSNTSIATVITGTGVVTGVLPGTAVITYSVASGCAAATVITVNPLPAAISGPASVCVNSTTTLSDAITGGTWSSDNTTTATINAASGSLSGETAGTATILYMSAAGCTVTKAVTVNPLPASIAGLVPVCAGSAIPLVDASTGGTWSITPAGIASISASTGVVTGILPGTATITYALSTGCTAAAIVTVSPAPAAIFGLSGVCPGATITLTDATSGGAWSTTSATATVDPSTGDVTGITAGTASITYTAGSCGAIKQITVNPVATITGATSVCLGSSITLSPSPGGGSWTSSSTAIASVNPAIGIVTGVLPGTALLAYTLTTGCVTAIIVTVNPLPASITSSSGHVCEGTTITLSDAVTGGTWSSSSSATATIDPASGALSGITPGTTVVSYSLATGCFAITTVTVDAIPSAIAGATSVCQGLSTSLTDIGIGTWSSDNSAIATVGSAPGSVTGVTPGTAVISFTFTSGCAAATVVTVNPTPAAISGPGTVCPGSIIALTDATSDGLWNATGTIATVDATGNVTGVSPGTAAITYTLGSCTTTTTVTVNPVAAIGGATHVCLFAATTLTDAVTGGTWSSGSTTTALADAVTGLVTGTTAGTANITYTTPAGCVSATMITVNSLPATITGAPVICAGNTATLLDATTPGTWSSANTAVATIGIAAGTFTGVAAGIAAITYTNSNGCTTATIITVNPLPSPITTGETSVCAGFTLTLSDAGGGTWTSSNTAVATIDGSGLLTSLSAGSITVTYTLPTGCITSIGIVADPQPAAITGTAVVCLGETSTLSNSGTGTWSSSDETIATVDGSGVVTGVAAGTAAITYTLTTGCFATDVVTVNACPGNGVKTVTGGTDKIGILPNPNKGEFTVSGSLNTITDEEVSLEITDLLGQTIYKENVTAQGGKINEHIKLKSTLANGTYILTVRSGTDNRIFHIILEQ